MSKKQKPPKLEQHLLQAMRVIDNRVARQMQRTPAEREVHGVQKWEPYRIVVEDICALLLNEIGDGKLQLDSLIGLNMALSKTLAMLVGDLGEKGLGDVRSSYVRAVLEQVAEDAQRSLQELRGERQLM